MDPPNARYSLLNPLSERFSPIYLGHWQELRMCFSSYGLQDRWLPWSYPPLSHLVSLWSVQEAVCEVEHLVTQRRAVWVIAESRVHIEVRPCQGVWSHLWSSRPGYGNLVQNGNRASQRGQKSGHGCDFDCLPIYDVCRGDPKAGWSHFPPSETVVQANSMAPSAFLEFQQIARFGASSGKVLHSPLNETLVLKHPDPRESYRRAHFRTSQWKHKIPHSAWSECCWTKVASDTRPTLGRCELEGKNKISFSKSVVWELDDIDLFRNPECEILPSGDDMSSMRCRKLSKIEWWRWGGGWSQPTVDYEGIRFLTTAGDVFWSQPTGFGTWYSTFGWAGG